jgi:hypothetical protein
MSTVVGTRRPPKRMRNLVAFPDDVMHLIFSKLSFKEKISCGLVCKQLDKLLKAGSAGGRHWVVNYHVNCQVLRAARLSSNREPAEESFTAATERCIAILQHPLYVQLPEHYVYSMTLVNRHKSSLF